MECSIYDRVAVKIAQGQDVVAVLLAERGHLVVRWETHSSGVQMHDFAGQHSLTDQHFIIS